jgi:cytosine/adenosine deaminase-related metal-dependent hydrolase
MILEGTVLRGRAFEPVEGRVVVEEGEIVAVEAAPTDSTDVICPAFVNAHTHVGDAIAKEAGEGLTLEELVAPPDGLKHRLLRQADRDEMVDAMRRALRFMADSGTTASLDFREGDVAGVEALQAAAEGLPIRALALGRGSLEAMAVGDGFGASGANDGEFITERRATADADKLFGIHAGEVDSSDVSEALDYEPDFLVHVVHPEAAHLERIARTATPVVVCPRSNVVTGVGLPPVAELAQRTTVALGTDNVMLNSPSMFREMAYTAKLTGVSAREVLAMATINGADIAGLHCGLVATGRDARLLVLDGDSANLAGAQDLVRAVVRRAGPADIARVVHGEPAE